MGDVSATQEGQDILFKRRARRRARHPLPKKGKASSSKQSVQWSRVQKVLLCPLYTWSISITWSRQDVLKVQSVKVSLSLSYLMFPDL